MNISTVIFLVVLVMFALIFYFPLRWLKKHNSRSIRNTTIIWILVIILVCILIMIISLASSMAGYGFWELTLTLPDVNNQAMISLLAGIASGATLLFLQWFSKTAYYDIKTAVTTHKWLGLIPMVSVTFGVLLAIVFIIAFIFKILFGI